MRLSDVNASGFFLSVPFGCAGNCLAFFGINLRRARGGSILFISSGTTRCIRPTQPLR